MNNEGGSGPQFELPPQPESPEEAGEQAQEKAAEKQRPAAQEAGVGKRAPQPGSTAVADDQAAVQIPDATATSPTDQKAPSKPVSQVTADLKAGDAELIEKDWIDRTKSIVAKTRDDPHSQKTEVSKAKADYIQKRFNKIIKTDEAAA